MGNRAVIVFKSLPGVGVYVHWNGGPESVLAFLEETRRRGSRSPAGDVTYAFARLVQTVADYFTRGETSELILVGAGPVELLDCDNGDNGTYLIGDDWSIQSRKHARSTRGVKRIPKGEEVKHQLILETLGRIDAAREAARDAFAAKSAPQGEGQ